MRAFSRLVKSSVLLLSCLLPLPALAVSQAVSNFQGSLNSAAGNAGLVIQASPATIVGNGISVILGLSGIVMVVYLVYAGILYMQAGMDPKKADKAKSLIVNSVIGLVIIVSAYAVSQFVFNLLTKAVATK